MIANFRIALRHLMKQRLNTLLHVTGLTLGIGVCLLIGIFIRYELSFDKYHKNADRTYRINSVWHDSGKENLHFSTPLPLAEALRDGVPGIQTVVLIHPQNNKVIEISPEKKFLQENILIASPELPDVFDFEVIRGDLRGALRKPYQAIVTETTARKFFGEDDPLGKSFKFKNQFEITVAAVIADIPPTSHMPATMLLSFVPNQDFLSSQPDAWTYVSGASTFVVVSSQFDVADLQKRLDVLANQHINSNQGLPKEMRASFDIQPLKDIHFQSEYGGGGAWVKAVDRTWLWFFASIGIAVLIIACINFVNLSTAQALSRAREVGVRKAVGAGKGQLLLQFLTEAWTLSFTSGIMALGLAYYALSAINVLMEKQLSLSIWQTPDVLLWLVAGIFCVGLFAGLYPAWIITRFNPVVTLKTGTAVAGNHGSSWLRKGLMTLQFSISAGLLIAVLLISQQVNFLRNKNLGFDKDNVLNVPVKSSGVPMMSNELNSLPQVRDYAFATGTPTNESHWGSIMSLTNGDDPNRHNVTLLFADHRFCDMYDIKLLSGRFLHPYDTNYIARSVPEKERVMRVLVNEKLVNTLGFGSANDAIGKHFWVGMNSGNAEIVGVVKNFNTSSLHESVSPVMIMQLPEVYNQVGIKIGGGTNVQEVIAAIGSSWKKVFPDDVFEFTFLDEQIDSYYKAETRLYQLFRIFAGLAMLISCLGLWGLSAFSAQQRTKEIGVRKVLGASSQGIVLLLSRDFVIMVVLALVVSSPFAYYLMNNWLQNFAYRIDIGWDVFAIAAVSSIVIALFTVSFQALKAALANPANSLRTE
jgi:putative ABC transport system permease protein